MSPAERGRDGLLTLLRQRPELAWLLIADLGLSGGLVSLGLSALAGHAACHLCIAQRAALLAIAPVALVAGVRFGSRGGRVAAALALLLALAGFAVALFQSVVERRAELACDDAVVPGWLESLVLRLGDLSPFLFAVDGACGAAAVGFAGVSLANLGAAAFAAMLVGGGWALRQGWRLAGPAS